jgi:hypothetical protein
MPAKCPAALRRAYDLGRVLPFIGAGVSMAVAWKDAAGNDKRGISWGELVDEATKQLGFEKPDLLRVRGTDLQILEYFQRKRSSFAPLSNWLYKEMSPPDHALSSSEIHRELAMLTKCSLFYTTNFDSFIERAFTLFSRPNRSIAVEQQMFGRSDPNACDIIKFHGDLDHPDKMVLSESDYQRRLNLQTDMDHRLRADMLGRMVLFLGYSFRDWNVSYIFRLMNEQMLGKSGSLPGTRGYITVPAPSDFEVRLFEERNIEVIPIDDRHPAKEIVSLLEDMRS